ncbi:MAG: prenyltransferase/squalene oxidase repeat-containing protein [Planctomycetaceae bacterium]
MMRLLTLTVLSAALLSATTARAAKIRKNPKLTRDIKKSVARGLDWLARQQRPQGYWDANQGQYRVAMTALCGMAFVCEGSTTTSGKYRKNIRKAVDWLTGLANRKTGLIGYKNDYRYTYGHGFSMLFLSQVYGDEEDEDRRKELKQVLIKAVRFSENAQTNRGGWGYVSAKDGNNFDEGSTCITQVQGLRACRNAGIPVRKGVIKMAKKYISDCTIKTGSQAGGVVYSYNNRGSARPPITAAAMAAVFNLGEYKGAHVKQMLEYCRKFVWPGASSGTRRSFGHWHYTHLYFSQVQYRKGDKEWKKYIEDIGPQILKQQSADGAWRKGYIGGVYTTAISLTILQLDKGYVPIYQR